MPNPLESAVSAAESVAPATLPYRFSSWKKGLVAAAVLLVILGIGVEAASDPAPPSSESLTVAANGAGTSGDANAIAGETTASGGASIQVTLDGDVSEKSAPGASDPRAAAMLRGGLGMFLGFSIGMALRLFMKIVSIFVGLNMLVLLFFAYLGWIEIRWDTMQEQGGDWFNSWLDELRSFRTFIQGHIPSTALTALGGYAGWRRS